MMFGDVQSFRRPRAGLAARRGGPTPDRALLVVAHARLVVGEEDLADEVAPAAHARLVEDALEVLLDGLGRDRRRAAISAVELPCSTSRVTSCSRSVNP